MASVDSTALKLRAEKHLQKFENNTQDATVKEVKEMMRLWPSSAKIMRDAGARYTRNKAPEVEDTALAAKKKRAQGVIADEAEAHLQSSMRLEVELEKALDRRNKLLVNQPLSDLKRLLTYIEPLAMSPWNIKGLATNEAQKNPSKADLVVTIEFLTGFAGTMDVFDSFKSMRAIGDHFAIMNRARGRLVKHLVSFPPKWAQMGIYR
eukprot:6459155-Amphidinium_carterae.1